MSEVIAPDNTELLKRVLGDVFQKTYIDVVRGVQAQMTEQIEQGDIEALDMPIHHYFAPDVYMRQMDAPAGALVVSKMHRTEHLNILLKGTVTLATEHGIKTITAPQVIKSMPGTKRIGYFHTDASWLTIHPTQETDLEKIEAQVIVPDDQIETFLKGIKYNHKEFLV